MTDYYLLTAEPAQEKWLWLTWVVIFEALFECYEIQTLGKRPIILRQRPDMALAVDWHLNLQFKRINKLKFDKSEQLPWKGHCKGALGCLNQISSERQTQAVVRVVIISVCHMMYVETL